MIYYDKNDVIIRDMLETDPEIITYEEHLQGWTHQKVEKYTQRLKDVAENKCVALVAEYKGNVAGYFNVYPDTKSGLFAGKGWPELIEISQSWHRQHIDASGGRYSAEICRYCLYRCRFAS